MRHIILMLGALLLSIGSGGELSWLWAMAVAYAVAELFRLRGRLSKLEAIVEDIERREKLAEIERQHGIPAQSADSDISHPKNQAIKSNETDDNEPELDSSAVVHRIISNDSDSLKASPIEIETQLVSPETTEPPHVIDEDPWVSSTAEYRKTQIQEAKPSLLNQCVSWVIGFFTEGNPLVRIGIVILFVAVGFLLKYIGEQYEISIAQRLVSVALGGVVLLSLGFALRNKRPAFALPLQGGGIGVLFLSTYAAFRLYQLIPSEIAFGLMVGLVVLTLLLAVKQDARILAVFGVAGGFVAPILTSTGQGSHVDLFSYYLILNVLIIIAAWFRSWRLLNWLGFVFTFAMGMAWGARFYRPEYFNSVEPFLLAHVVLYIAVAVLFASRQEPRLKGLVDATIVFGTPIVGFAIQTALLADDASALAWSALIFGLSYLLLAALLRLREATQFRLLIQCFMALGIGFITLAVPIAFDARVTSAMWVLEGAAVSWVGVRQSRWFPKFSGVGLMLLGSLAFLLESPVRGEQLILLNANHLGVILIAGAFAFISHIWRQQSVQDLSGQQAGNTLLAGLFWLYALLWWLGGSLFEIDWHLQSGMRLVAAVGLLGLTAVLTYHYGKKQQSTVHLFSACITAFLNFYLLISWSAAHGDYLFINANMLAMLISSISAVYIARGIHFARILTTPFSWADLLGSVALAAWLLEGMIQLHAHLAQILAISLSLLWVTLSFTAGYLGSESVFWRRWRLCLYPLLSMPVLFLISYKLTGTAVFSWTSVPAWIIVFSAIYFLLRRSQNHQQVGLNPMHGLTMLSMVICVSLGANDWLGNQYGMASAIAVSSLAFAPIVLMMLFSHALLGNRWPFLAYPVVYYGVYRLPIYTAMGLWLVWVSLNTPPAFILFSYLPVLNLLDLTTLGVLLSLGLWIQRQQGGLWIGFTNQAKCVLGGLAFISLNAALLRAIHFISEIEYAFDPMWCSFTVQASVTVLWVFSALVLMIVANRQKIRQLWILGAALMAISVLKLFVVDTAGSGSLARILAFFGVSGGLLLAGYFVPRPPARSEVSTAETVEHS